MINTNDDFEGPCEFHSNILSQNCSDQYSWLVNALSSVPSDDWLVIVGHHPIDEVDMEDMTSLIQKHGFSIYLNGHAHTLTQYTVDGSGAYVTTGAGALVNTADQTHPKTSVRVAGGNLEGESSPNSHSYQTIFNQQIAGFTLHTFNSDFTSLTTDYISYKGDILHSFSVDKSGTVSR
jgi:hypothetical protein